MIVKPLLYLLLVSFYGPTMQGDVSAFSWSNLKSSPYSGVALRLKGAYNVDRVNYVDAANKLKLIKEETEKDVLPWVFLNQIVRWGWEQNVDELSEKQMSYFKNIDGLDLSANDGPLADFIYTYKCALRLAWNNLSPGIVLDPEFYNDRQMNIIEKVAARNGVAEKQVVTSLKNMGRKLADIADAEYPGVVIWTLFTGFSLNYNHTRYMIAPAYIFLGLLDRCVEKEYELKLVAGGELSLDYSSESLDQLRRKIDSRNLKYKTHLNNYKDLLCLAGTISVWEKDTGRTGWLMDRKTDIKTSVEFTPYLTTLAESYNHLWIYAATMSDYDPYDVKKSESLHALLNKYLNISAPKRLRYRLD